MYWTTRLNGKYVFVKGNRIDNANNATAVVQGSVLGH